MNNDSAEAMDPFVGSQGDQFSFQSSHISIVAKWDYSLVMVDAVGSQSVLLL